MSPSSSDKGRLGEEQAAAFFREKGYEILARRFRSGPGEVDIICRKEDTVVFAEVKAWDVLGLEDLERSVDSRKREKIRKAASVFLRSHSELGGCRIRFDLVFLSRRTGELDHWENAF